MLNVLCPNFDCRNIKYVGFDLDGTLYDEFDFIYQVYSKIVKANASLLGDNMSALNWMKERWLEKGSSYNLIFDEAYERFGVGGRKKTFFIEKSVEIFRNFKPDLKLSDRTTTILDDLKDKYRLFLVTDGNSMLQRQKFVSLGLGKWFLKENCIFTGDYGKSNYKPSVKAMQQFFSKCSPSKCLFFGDRDVDREFAEFAGMNFVRMTNMMVVK